MNYNRFIEPSTLADQQRLAGLEVKEETKLLPTKKTKHGEMNPPSITPKIRSELALKVGTTARDVEVIPGVKKPHTAFSNDYKQRWIRVGATWLKKHGY